MRRPLKVGLYALLTVAGLVIAFVVSLLWAIQQPSDTTILEQQVLLANNAFVKVKGTPTPGPDTGYSWEISYRDQREWEKVGDWWNIGNGDVVACPVGNVIVVARTNGDHVFVRTAAGSWKEFLMDIPGPWYFSKNGELGPNFTSLESDEVFSIRRQMSLDPTAGNADPYLAQFLPRRQELWLDYLVEHRRFRVKLKMFANGERFRPLSVEELAFDRNRPYFDQFIPDIPDDPACNRIEFYRRTPDLLSGRGTAVLLDPSLPGAPLESAEGWRVSNPKGPHPERIYLVLHGELRWIPSMDTYRNLFGTTDLSEVHVVGKEFDKIPEGDPFSADAGLRRFPDEPAKIYLFDTFEYHWIQNDETLKRYGFDRATARHDATYLRKEHVGEPL